MPKLSATTFKLNTQQDMYMAARIGDGIWLRQVLTTNTSYLDIPNEKGLTAFHIAALECKCDLLKIFIEDYDLDVNSSTASGWTAMHLCISNTKLKESYKCLQYLISMDAYVNSRTLMGQLPLHLAGSVGHLKAIKLLIENNSEVDVKDEKGQNPYALALIWGHRDAARVLAHHVWLKTKIDEAKQKHAVQKYCQNLNLQNNNFNELNRTESILLSHQSYVDWYERNNFVYNPLLFGPVTKIERGNIEKEVEKKTAKELSDPQKKTIDSRIVTMRKEKQEKQAIIDDRKVQLLPLLNSFKV